MLLVKIYDPTRKEIQSWPLEVKKDLGSILLKLQKGERIGAPDSVPMKTVAQGVFEIRLKDISGIFRVFYLIKTEIGILVFHSFIKKTQKTPISEIHTGRERLKRFMKELENEN